MSLSSDHRLSLVEQLILYAVATTARQFHQTPDLGEVDVGRYLPVDAFDTNPRVRLNKVNDQWIGKMSLRSQTIIWGP